MQVSSTLSAPEKEIEPGTIVKLISGGPWMCVESTRFADRRVDWFAASPSGDFKKIINCVWFDKHNVVHRQGFLSETLSFKA